MNENNKKVIIKELQIISNKSSKKEDKDKSIKSVQEILDKMKTDKDITVQNDANEIQVEFDIIKKDDAQDNDKIIAFNKIIQLLSKKKENNKNLSKLPDIGLGFVNAFFTSFLIFFYFYGIRIIIALSNPPILDKIINNNFGMSVQNKMNEILTDGSFTSRIVNMISSLNVEDKKLYGELSKVIVFYALITSLSSMSLNGKKLPKYSSFMMYFMSSSWLPPVLLIGFIVTLYKLCTFGFSKIRKDTSGFKIKLYLSAFFIFIALFGIYDVINIILMAYTKQWFFLFTPIVCTIAYYIAQDIYNNVNTSNPLFKLLKYILTPILIIIPYFIFTVFNYVS